jgi:hypothetical protein
MKHLSSVWGSRLMISWVLTSCSEDAAPARSEPSALSATDGRAGAEGDSSSPAGEEVAPLGGDDSELNPTSIQRESPEAAAPPSPSVAAISDASVPAVDSNIDAGVAEEEEGWEVLFNGENLDGWTVSRGGGAGQAAEEIFQVTDGMIHVYKGAIQGSTQPTATLRTNAAYGSYVLHLEYMWGTTRFSDRSNTERDAGILFHLFNNLNAVWPDSFEFQLGSSDLGGEWVSGDIFVIGSNARGETSSMQLGGNSAFAELADGAMRRSIGAPTSYDRARTNAKLDVTGWNTVELTVRADSEAEYKVNGVVANRVFAMEANSAGVWWPLESGPIALQAEYAELFYRNVRLKQLP